MRHNRESSEKAVMINSHYSEQVKFNDSLMTHDHSLLFAFCPWLSCLCGWVLFILHRSQCSRDWRFEIIYQRRGKLSSKCSLEVRILSLIFPLINSTISKYWKGKYKLFLSLWLCRLCLKTLPNFHPENENWKEILLLMSIRRKKDRHLLVFFLPTFWRSNNSNLLGEIKKKIWRKKKKKCRWIWGFWIVPTRLVDKIWLKITNMLWSDFSYRGSNMILYVKCVFV